MPTLRAVACSARAQKDTNSWRSSFTSVKTHTQKNQLYAIQPLVCSLTNELRQTIRISIYSSRPSIVVAIAIEVAIQKTRSIAVAGAAARPSASRSTDNRWKKTNSRSRSERSQSPESVPVAQPIGAQPERPHQTPVGRRVAIEIVVEVAIAEAVAVAVVSATGATIAGVRVWRQCARTDGRRISLSNGRPPRFRTERQPIVDAVSVAIVGAAPVPIAVAIVDRSVAVRCCDPCICRQIDTGRVGIASADRDGLVAVHQHAHFVVVRLDHNANGFRCIGILGISN